MPLFPSVEWFEEVKKAVNGSREFRALGNCDTSMGVKVGERAFRLKFEAFACEGVSEVGVEGLGELDFYLEMSPGEWRELLDNIKANDGADGEHSLNTLDLSREGGVLRAKDDLLRQSFFRYHLSIQNFFDASAQVETLFAG